MRPLFVTALLSLVCVVTHASSPTMARANAVLDALHEAASTAEGKRYFGLFTEDAIFLGTDATERWTIAQFRAYAEPHFSKGRGWTYIPKERNINIARDGQHASFDELLENESLGLCRGTGVLRSVEGQWKIEQYHLAIPVPNALARDVVDLIKKAEADASLPASAP